MLIFVDVNDQMCVNVKIFDLNDPTLNYCPEVLKTFFYYRTLQVFLVIRGRYVLEILYRELLRIRK